MDVLGAGEEAITLPTELMLKHQINPIPEMMQIFKAFKIRQVSLNYTVNKNKGKVGKELLIYNF